MTSFLPPPGEEASFPFDDDGGNKWALRHGSSLSLMSHVCEFLANPIQEDTFNYVDPTADHHKWARKGMDLYYACVVDSTNGNILCALRAATQGLAINNNNDSVNNNNDSDNNTTKPRHRRFLIDYVYTEPSSRDKGIAGRLVSAVLDMATAFQATCYVLSIEESCVYWMEKHQFYLCQDKALNKAMNVFPDTHLLRRQSGRDDDDTDDPMEVDDKENHADNSNNHTTVPPDSFTKALQQLVLVQHSDPEGLQLCLKTLATLIQNAKNDESDDGKRRKCRINNPHVQRRVFSIGGDAAMQLLQTCGFQLQVDDDGDAILMFEGDSIQWLPTAITRLEQEATTNK